MNIFCLGDLCVNVFVFLWLIVKHHYVFEGATDDMFHVFVVAQSVVHLGEQERGREKKRRKKKKKRKEKKKKEEKEKEKDLFKDFDV